MKHPLPVVVIGAGCAGLWAAQRLRENNFEVVVIEADSVVGGLAGAVRVGGDAYEYGPHIFHTPDSWLLKKIIDLMGCELIPFQRTMRIKFMGSYFEFPLSLIDVLRKLPPVIVLTAGAGLLWAHVKGAFQWKKPGNSEDVLLGFYGAPLYRLFFRDYIARIWGICASQLSPAFALERIPRLNIWKWTDAFFGFLRRMRDPGGTIKTYGYVERVEGDLYTTRQGFPLVLERLAQKLRGQGVRILLNASMTRICREGCRVVSVELEQEGQKINLPCVGVINTAAITQAVQSLSPSLGEDVLAALAKLQFRSLVFVGIKVNRSKVLPASFMYFREHSFNRITDFSHFGFETEPAGHSLLVAEVACQTSDAIWTNDRWAQDMVIADLVRENILRQEEIVAACVFRARFGHPIYGLGYEKALHAVLRSLGSLENFQTAGRQGRFQYVNSHVAMKMGEEAADALADQIKRQVRILS